MKRRNMRIGLIGILALIFVVAGAAVWAQDYPKRPITFIIPYEAGSGGDVVTRPLAEGAGKKLGVPMVIINKPGASGTVGLRDILDAKPDGYTIGQHTALHVNKLQGLFPKNQKDVDMIGVFQADWEVVCCNSKKPWKTIQELIAYAKAHPEEVKLATSSKGAVAWVATMAFMDVTGIKLNVLPQPGAAGMAVLQAAGGHADLVLSGMPEARTQVDAGNLRPLAILAPTRMTGKYSYTPTLKEAGYNLDFPIMRCALGPKGMPKPVLDKLRRVFGEVAQSKEYKDFLAHEQSIPLWLPGDQGVKAWDDQEKIIRPILEKTGLLKEAK